MNIKESLLERSNHKCELCGNTENLDVYKLPPSLNETLDNSIIVCNTCLDQITNNTEIDQNHWRCLNDAMWSEHTPVQIASWRMLHRLKSGGWSQDLLDMMYLDDENLRFAEASGDHLNDDEKIIHRDCNGAILAGGDTVTLTKDLEVKGTGSFTAKRGTAVRNISLVYDNAEQIEGRVEGQQIVILTKFVKKANAPQQS